MSLGSLIGDDEHTGAEDAYCRALKCRKWVVLSAVAAWVVAHGFYAATPFSIYIGKVSLPLWVWHVVPMSALIYAGGQYLLLIVQLFTRYPSILRARAFDRQSERLALATAAHDEILAKSDELNQKIRQAEASDQHEDIVDNIRFQRNEVLEAANRQQAKLKLIRRDTYGLSYIIAEVCIDIIRIVSPIVLSILALWAVAEPHAKLILHCLIQP